MEANVLKFRNQLCCMLWRQDDDCGAERIDSCSKTKSPTFSWDSSLIHQDAPGKHSENTTTSDTFYATERHDDIMLGSILSAERFQMVVPSNRDAEEVQHCKLLQPTCDFPVLIKILSSIRIVTRRKRLTNDPCSHAHKKVALRDPDPHQDLNYRDIFAIPVAAYVTAATKSLDILTEKLARKQFKSETMPYDRSTFEDSLLGKLGRFSDFSMDLRRSRREAKKRQLGAIVPYRTASKVEASDYLRVAIMAAMSILQHQRRKQQIPCFETSTENESTIYSDSNDIQSRAVKKGHEYSNLEEGLDSVRPHTGTKRVGSRPSNQTCVSSSSGLKQLPRNFGNEKRRKLEVDGNNGPRPCKERKRSSTARPSSSRYLDGSKLPQIYTIEMDSELTEDTTGSSREQEARNKEASLLERFGLHLLDDDTNSDRQDETNTNLDSSGRPVPDFASLANSGSQRQTGPPLRCGTPSSLDRMIRRQNIKKVRQESKSTGSVLSEITNLDHLLGNRTSDASKVQKDENMPPLAIDAKRIHPFNPADCRVKHVRDNSIEDDITYRDNGHLLKLSCWQEDKPSVDRELCERSPPSCTSDTSEGDGMLPPDSFCVERIGVQEIGYNEVRSREIASETRLLKEAYKHSNKRDSDDDERTTTENSEKPCNVQVVNENETAKRKLKRMREESKRVERKEKRERKRERKKLKKQRLTQRAGKGLDAIAQSKMDRDAETKSAEKLSSEPTKAPAYVETHFQPTNQNHDKSHVHVRDNAQLKAPECSKGLDYLMTKTSACRPETPLQLLCSETFLESYGEAIAELASGRWSKQEESPSQEEHFGREPYSCSDLDAGQKITFIDTSLMDESGIDIEIPGRGAIIVTSLSCWPDVESTKSLVRRVVEVASTSRYQTLEIFVCADMEISEPAVEIIMKLQNSLLRKNRKTQTVASCRVVSSRTLSASIAYSVLFSGFSQASNSNLEIFLADDRNRERASFLCSIIPTLTVGGALECLSVRVNNRPNLNSSDEEEESRKWFQNLLGKDDRERKRLLMRLKSEPKSFRDLHLVSILQLSFVVNSFLGHQNGPC